MSNICSLVASSACDLLAVRSGRPLGVQVKLADLPLRFKKTEWNRMEAEAKRNGWNFTVASVEKVSKGRVRFLDHGRAHVARGVTLDDSTIIENLLAWMR